MNATETISKMRNNADSIRDTRPISLANMEPGDCHAQGDVDMTRLPDGWIAANANKVLAVNDWAGVQIVPGATQGSRHCLDSTRGIEFFRFAANNPLDLCVVRAERHFALLHPEHAHLTDIPAGEYAFTAQRAFADELRRQAD